MSRRSLFVMSGLATASLVLVGGAFGAGFALAGGPGLIAQAQEVAETTTSAEEIGRALPLASPSPLRVRTCSVGALVNDERLGSLSAVVLEPESGDVLFSRMGETSVAPASVAKIVTAAVALTALGPERTFSTTVVQSSEPGTIVLVAGGDPTLSLTPEGSESVYQGAPKMSNLASQVLASLSEGLPQGERVRIDTVVIDSSLFGQEDTWNSTWSSDARAKGYISQVTALQVDGDRRDPAVTLGRRSDDASSRAARAFVDALRAAGNAARYVEVIEGKADEGAQVLGQVQSRPVSELVTYMLKESDNTLAEYLARHSALAMGKDPLFDAVDPAFEGVLAAAGLPSDHVTLVDGSGLSASNQVTPLFIAQLLREIYADAGSVGQIRDGLPIAGVDGSLDDRFVDENAVLVGRVMAKTGSISGVRSLAGFVTADDGADLVFAVFATGDVDDSARPAIESLVAGFSACGENLADF